MSPPEASTNDEVRCPHCAATFTLGSAVEVSLPKLIRVQQQRQESRSVAFDTTEEIPWALWAELVVDESSIDGKPIEKEHEHIATPAVHVTESEPTGEAPFQTTAAPGSESSAVENDEDLFGFVIEGEEASKICSKQELELSEQDASRSGKKVVEFDLTFDESLLGEEDSAEAHDMFDFDAEAGELGPGEFDIPTQRGTVATAQPPVSRATAEKRVAGPVLFSKIGHSRRPSQTQLSMIIAAAGAFLLFVLYYTLNFFGGAKFDLLGIYLPGCPHTYGSEPEFAPTIGETDGAVSSLEQNSGYSPGGNNKPSPHTVRRPSGNNHSGGNTQDPGPEPTYRTSLAPTFSKDGLYQDPEIILSTSISYAEKREIFQLPEGKVGLITHPVFEVKDVEALLHQVHSDFGCPKCNSTGYILSPDGKEKYECDSCFGDPGNALTMLNYPEFCQLGQIVSLMKEDSKRANDARDHVRELLDKVVTSRQKYRELGKIALDRLQPPLYHTEGIMLTGLVQFTAPVDKADLLKDAVPEGGLLYVANILLPDSEQRVFVVADHPFPFQAGDSVVLLGMVVPEPEEKIAGFPKTNKKNKLWIWYGESIILPYSLPEQEKPFNKDHLKKNSGDGLYPISSSPSGLVPSSDPLPSDP